MDSDEVDTSKGSWLRTMGLAGLSLGASLGFGVGWHLSNKVRDDILTMPTPVPDYTVEILRAQHGSVVVRDEWADDTNLGRPEAVTLRWPEGSALLGPVIENREGTVEREATFVEAVPPAGTMADSDPYVFGDPGEYGATVEDVVVDGPLGALPAWLRRGSGATWVIAVHGLEGTGRRTMIRYLDSFGDLPQLVVSMRNDAGAPQMQDRRVGFGSTEWRDVEAAVRFARDNGADRVVLFGISMGGAIVISTLLRSSLARDLCIGAVLDSPAVDLEAVVRSSADRMGVPTPAVHVGVALTERRFRFSFDEVDYVSQVASRPGGLGVPALVIAGEADTAIPHESIERFVYACPGAELVSLPEVGHVRAWNVDRAHYDQLVGHRLRDWLAD